ncbi:hypothetical protein I3843_06G119600 [Carya illinoinensis]|uniref:BHLH domain-containing protein n=1 Tax=Carya illinoinensis TaxID=32201 RepID=A0A8T1QAU6_CARIL|nr:transcription factor bHLH121-like isoform X1 [Carya illinoinensis]KAG2703208.1 hypothetical protein I3760_06G127500 [Carya illinoinensis]KAG6651616.1 hypothetical protein CIPAW_06G125400 [Carya illinoinensis]KAG6709295.1 hypothetical protein I3842_06G125500 [Carya illinoinensis]KAG7975827.1 hypothetical protein I3843_06G119600 [Carya illinoinensis]
MDFIQTVSAPDFHPTPQNPGELSTPSVPYSSQRYEVDSERKTQKAGREKLRRDRLNEQFVELGNVVDPSRPKNDKSTILVDTIQLLKDLASQINKLKAECSTLTEESHELMQEKNDLREEKASLKSDIENLNVQCQQRLGAMFPWAAIDHSVVMGPPSYQFPVPMPMPPGPIPMHPSMQPYPFFGNQNPGLIPNPCSTFVPYVTPNTSVEQSAWHASPRNRSPILNKQDSRCKSSGKSKTGESEDSDNVTTDLELKTPGSTEDQDLSPEPKNSRKRRREENSVTEGSSSSRSSSSVQDSSSNIVVGGIADE